MTKWDEQEKQKSNPVSALFYFAILFLAIGFTLGVFWGLWYGSALEESQLIPPAYGEHYEPIYFQEPEIINVQQGFGTITATVKINEKAFFMVPAIVKGQYLPYTWGVSFDGTTGTFKGVADPPVWLSLHKNTPQGVPTSGVVGSTVTWTWNQYFGEPLIKGERYDITFHGGKAGNYPKETPIITVILLDGLTQAEADAIVPPTPVDVCPTGYKDFENDVPPNTCRNYLSRSTPGFGQCPAGYERIIVGGYYICKWVEVEVEPQPDTTPPPNTCPVNYEVVNGECVLIGTEPDPTPEPEPEPIPDVPQDFEIIVEDGLGISDDVTVVVTTPEPEPEPTPDPPVDNILNITAINERFNYIEMAIERLEDQQNILLNFYNYIKDFFTIPSAFALHTGEPLGLGYQYEPNIISIELIDNDIHITWEQPTYPPTYVGGEPTNTNVPLGGWFLKYNQGEIAVAFGYNNLPSIPILEKPAIGGSVTTVFPNTLPETLYCFTINAQWSQAYYGVNSPIACVITDGVTPEPEPTPIPVPEMCDEGYTEVNGVCVLIIIPDLPDDSVTLSSLTEINDRLNYLEMEVGELKAKVLSLELFSTFQELRILVLEIIIEDIKEFWLNIEL